MLLIKCSYKTMLYMLQTFIIITCYFLMNKFCFNPYIFVIAFFKIIIIIVWLINLFNNIIILKFGLKCFSLSLNLIIKYMNLFNFKPIDF